VLDIILIITNVFTIVGILFIIIQIRQTRESLNQTCKSLEKETKRITIDLLNELSQYSNEILKKIDGKSLSYAAIRANAELNHDVTMYLNRFERFSIGVEEDVYDYNIICQAGLRIANKYERFQNYIQEVRKEKKNTMLYRTFENLVQKLDSDCLTDEKN